jgi:hypothetical protein
VKTQFEDVEKIKTLSNALPSSALPRQAGTVLQEMEKNEE